MLTKSWKKSKDCDKKNAGWWPALLIIYTVHIQHAFASIPQARVCRLRRRRPIFSTRRGIPGLLQSFHGLHTFRQISIHCWRASSYPHWKWKWRKSGRIGSLRQFNRLIKRFKRGNREDRPENFLAHDFHCVINIDKHGRLIIVAFVPFGLVLKAQALGFPASPQTNP